MSSSTDARWLDALQRLAARSAHELKGALNGVSVNIEVIRSRAAKATAAAGALAPFADAASAQLDDVIELSEALLGLARPAHEPVDIGLETKRIVTLLSSAARADGRRLVIDDAAAVNQLGITSAPGSAVRVAICDCLLAAVDASLKTRCAAASDRAAPALRVIAGDGDTVTVAGDAVVAAAEAGIDIHVEHSVISISFPR